MSSCKFNSNIQGHGVDYLQGVWVEDHAGYQIQRLEYTLHTFKFTCDSFYLKLDTYAKVNRYFDHCFNQGHWTEYVKGTYLVNKDTLVLNGTFTKSNFKQKISGCYRIGQYVRAFFIEKKCDSFLILQDVSQHMPVSLRLQQKISCIPKPIN
ncbi:MAG: fumarate hydratase [Sphingobacteriaceae bacterium]|nr:MAG: fumarate hydratase [Pedobacter sp.]